MSRFSPHVCSLATTGTIAVRRISVGQPGTSAGGSGATGQSPALTGEGGNEGDGEAQATNNAPASTETANTHFTS